ncbi:MAG: HAD superfamily 5'-nucleotidase-like hydrolase [Bradymonadia bacterium]|jgi:HAD superfamily 5'-nucleotidase-like hydrolase
MYSPDEERSRYIALLLRLGSRFDEGRFRRVYVNRDLNQKAINWIGFDMDYTLGVYNQTEFDRLCHALTMERMVERYGYPEAIRAIVYDGSFAIRGLVVDRKLGHILKVDAHGHVVKACHGLTPMPREAAEEYRKDPPELSERRYDILDTLFGLPEAFGYAAVVDHLEAAGVEVNFEVLADQIRDSIDSIHADGTLKTEVMGDLSRYFNRDRRLGPALHRLRSAGKKLFLMTNSFYPYTNAVMSYLLENGPADYKDWKGYFDVIITGAKKPSFFKPGRPFFVLDDAGDVIG